MTNVHVISGQRRVDLNLLRVFDTVYRERNLTRSAAALALSQSAVSHALSRLRDQLGDPLFVRKGFGVRPTPLAARLAPSIQQALAGLRQALQRGVGFDPAQDLDHLTIAIPEEMEMLVLPLLVEHLRAAAPGAAIASVRLDRANLAADLASGRLHLAIDVARVAGAELRHAPLVQDRYCVVASRNRRLTAQAYLEAAHVAVSSRRSGPAMEDFVLNSRGLQRRILLRCQNYVAACRIAAASDLVLTMPRQYAQILGGAIGFRPMPMPIDLSAIDIHYYWHRQADEEPASQWLRAQLAALSASYAKAASGRVRPNPRTGRSRAKTPTPEQNHGARTPAPPAKSTRARPR